MTAPVIKVEKLAKQYRLGHLLDHRRSFREALMDAGSAPFRRLRRIGTPPNAEEDTIWALKDVSLEIRQGDVLGIIGRNGAGKTTLLKILSEITYPTRGQVVIRGRVASLLEVGTGFHPELTGRENVFLNGAILGMSRSEVRSKFDEMVSFAEVEDFIDTPVKRYSSGMQVRLAFAVAAHLEPEILLVDEVLAVGDTAFQRKCLGKMDNVARSGRTIVFVSHNMAAVSNICTKGVHLDRGRAVYHGDIKDTVGHYLDTIESADEPAAMPGQDTRVTAMGFPDDLGGLARRKTVLMGEGFAFRVAYRLPKATRRPVLGMVLRRSTTGEMVAGVNTRMTGDLAFDHPVNEVDLTLRMDDLNLIQGSYVVDLYLGNERENFEVVHGALTLDVAEADVFGTGKLPFPHFGPVFTRPTIEVHSAD